MSTAAQASRPHAGLEYDYDERRCMPCAGKTKQRRPHGAAADAWVCCVCGVAQGNRDPYAGPIEGETWESLAAMTHAPGAGEGSGSAWPTLRLACTVCGAEYAEQCGTGAQRAACACKPVDHVAAHDSVMARAIAAEEALAHWKGAYAEMLRMYGVEAGDATRAWRHVRELEERLAAVRAGLEGRTEP